MKRILSNLLILVFVIGVALWSAANRHFVAIEPFGFEMPLFLIFFIGIAIGIAAAAVAGLTRRVQSHVRARRAEKSADAAESRADALREELDAPERRSAERVAAIEAQESVKPPANI